MVVVAASDGYPGKYLSGKKIELSREDDDHAWLIHAGTRQDGDELVTAGGRVLGAVGLGRNLQRAREAAYGLLGDTHFEGLTYRRDIGVPKEEEHAR